MRLGSGKVRAFVSAVFICAALASCERPDPPDIPGVYHGVGFDQAVTVRFDADGTLAVSGPDNPAFEARWRIMDGPQDPDCLQLQIDGARFRPEGVTPGSQSHPCAFRIVTGQIRIGLGEDEDLHLDRQ